MDQDLVPTGRNGAPFVMSSRAVGLADPRVANGRATWTMKEYARRGGHPITIPQAVAISGAAIAPVAGREEGWRPYRALFAIANVRLGVWLPNPYWNRRDWAPHREAGDRRRRVGPLSRSVVGLDRWFSHPSGLSVLREAFGTIGAFAPWVYVTDGGHYDNLGLLEALRRRPRHIIMLDGSGDAEDQFPTMARAIATAKMDQDVDICFDPAPITRGTGKAPERGWVLATAKWADGSTCVIHYVKSVLPPHFPWELSGYKLSHPGFPATESSLEMYTEFDFEAYRLLGYELTRQADLWGCPGAAPFRPVVGEHSLVSRARSVLGGR
jgi:hypothetical protein